VYEIILTRQASRALMKLPKKTTLQIREKMAEIALDPFAHHSSVTKLQNRPGYRLRIGDWRVIYDIRQEKLILIVIKIGLRGEIYR
jgi:mRNA interferase RelE/StbE